MSKEHDKLIKKVELAQKSLDDAKAELKALLKESPLPPPKAYTLHELRMIKEKTDKPTVEDHVKSNASGAARLAKEAIINEAKSNS